MRAVTCVSILALLTGYPMAPRHARLGQKVRGCSGGVVWTSTLRWTTDRGVGVTVVIKYPKSGE